MAFKDYVEQDLNVFFNVEELGETHNLNGKDVTLVMDNELLKERQIKAAEGTYIGDLLFHIRKSEWGKKPVIRKQIVTFDQAKHRVSDYSEDNGICTVTLEAYVS